MDGPRVAVVGGGLAGLAAARRLREAGCSVCVLECRARLGGRATSDERQGFVLESGPHLVGAADRQLLELVRSAGLGERLLPLRPVRLEQLHRGGRQQIEPVGWRGVARLPGVRAYEAFRLRRMGRLMRRFEDIVDPGRPERAARLDDRSVADFVRLYFGSSVLRGWVAPLLAADLQAESDSASRLLFWLHLRARHAVPTGTFRAPLARLAEALAEPGQDRLECEVLGLEPASGGGLQVHPREGASLEVDAVVVATPARPAQRLTEALLVSAERELLARGRMGPAIVMCAALEGERVPCATRIRVPPALGLPASVVMLEPGGGSARAPEGHSLAVLVATPGWSRTHLEAPDEAVEKELLGVLERLCPGAGSALRFCALRRHAAALPRFDVGRYREIARLRRIEGECRAQGRRLYWAGDHLVGPTLEAAVGSGLRAAGELIGDFGL